jgi:hypothetical protein
MEARRESATAGMTTNSVVVTVEGVEKIKITMEGMERWRRSSVHRGGR